MTKRSRSARIARCSSLVMVMLLLVAVSRGTSTGNSQSFGFCPASGLVFLEANGTVYEGSAVRQPEGIFDGWTYDTYSFTATASDGSTITGSFRLSEANCALAEETGGWTTPDDYIIETYHTPQTPTEG